MPLIVLTKSSISPETGTPSTLRVKSPFATARVAIATLRTCKVKFAAIVFTLSVRS
jgi:hypothetical protein